jgi:hypothetical protein
MDRLATDNHTSASLSGQRHPNPSLAQSLAIGAGGFGLVSLIVFGFWAYAGSWFYRRVGEAGFYAACALLFVLLSGVALHPLVERPRRVRRFYRVFVPAFLAYAVVWSAAWFLSLPRHARWGEWIGSLAGCSILAWILVRGLSKQASPGWAALILFVLHSAGYFSGGVWMYWLLGPEGAEWLPEWSRAERALFAKLGWGLLYGLGFGAGLGCAFHLAQRGRAPDLVTGSKAGRSKPGEEGSQLKVENP